ncbi:MAG: hypothetical protein HON47_02235 [Candidatus Diapherotrites archaeon]|jgi:hypothetical protein|uniref:Uncharacterized protein n=1 Tax=Candidatus Iainarchaeum sp. TaxID=3101447 RepID=A0A8T5GEG2_9ARCH|nr:hypothetical protein [Candidatus Diapherotrites archaeon]MBT7241252.1 hypothetical protein [Candidatus Diapherotrites archaeon]
MEKNKSKLSFPGNRKFTIGGAPSGVGDYFMRWLFFYTNMHELGLSYLHTPANLTKTHTTDAYDKLTEILGFGIFTKISQTDQENILNLSLLELIEAYEKGGKEAFREYVISQDSNENTIFMIDVNERRNIGGKAMMGNISELLKPTRFKINTMREEYLGNIESLTESPIQKNKINIAVHVRRGDLSLFASFFRLANNAHYPIKFFKEKFLPIKYYLVILDELVNIIGEDNCHINVFSDGNYKAVNIMINNKLKDNNKDKIIESLKENDLDAEFLAFNKYKNVSLYIGDDFDLFKKSFCGLTHSDVVIGAKESSFFFISKYYKKYGDQVRIEFLETRECTFDKEELIRNNRISKALSKNRFN